jgi:hypothetical protein
MYYASLNEKLERERGKLERMIREAIDSGRPVLVDEEILRQSCKVDLLVNEIQEQERMEEDAGGF